MKTALIALGVGVGLFAAAMYAYKPQRQKADLEAYKASREAKVQAALMRGVIETDIDTKYGEITVMDIPTRGRIRVEYQRCFVYREFGKLAMSCPVDNSEPQIDTSDSGDGLDVRYR